HDFMSAHLSAQLVLKIQSKTSLPILMTKFQVASSQPLMSAHFSAHVVLNIQFQMSSAMSIAHAQDLCNIPQKSSKIGPTTFQTSSVLVFIPPKSESQAFLRRPTARIIAPIARPFALIKNIIAPPKLKNP